jgi:hypothetical protein
MYGQYPQQQVPQQQQQFQQQQPVNPFASMGSPGQYPSPGYPPANPFQQQQPQQTASNYPFPSGF